MLRFKEYISEAQVPKGSLTIFDIDDTLFTTTTKVLVKRGGNPVNALTPAEFNVYTLKDDEVFDFSQFRSAKAFADTARPIGNVFRIAKKLINRLVPNKRIIIVTARSDLDDKKLFLATFKKYGFDTDKVHVYRAGNILKHGAEAKKDIIRDQINKGKYISVKMFDDAKANLDKFIELHREYPDMSFEAFLIHYDGRITRYNR